MFRSLLALMCAAVTVCPSAVVADDCTVSAKGRFELIRKAEIFKDSRVGYSGQTPGEVREFRCILKRPDAEAVFAQLLDESTSSGRLYALCGLFISNRAVFDSVAARYRRDATEVKAQFGCILTSVRFSDALRQIEEEGLAQRLASDDGGG